MEDFEEKTAEEEFLQAVFKYLERSSQDKVKLLEVNRYICMMQSAAKLKDMLAENLETGTIETEIDEMLNVGTISAEIPSFTVMSIPRFIEIVSNADNFEIYPLTNGDIRLTMSFYSMLRTIK